MLAGYSPIHRLFGLHAAFIPASRTEQVPCYLLGVALIVSVLSAIPVHAATYYVDFDSGSDSNSGRERDSAWKRSPGDPAAMDIARSAILMPGDIVLFRGGVNYRGEISVNASGAMNNPILFKGDGWGSKKACFEGADRWEAEWTACPSQESASGNPNFEKIYYAAAPSGLSNFQSGLYEDNDFLWYSQGPDVSDPFYFDNNYEYYPIEQGSSLIRQSRNAVTDPTRLDQPDAEFWRGAHVATWMQGNLVTIKPVVSFDPTSHTIYHEDLEADIYGDRTSYYSLLNHVSLISRPGEYALDPARNRLYVWPRNSDDANLHKYSVQMRDTAFRLASQSHITLEGFRIQHFAQAFHASSTSAEAVIVRNNEVSKLRSANKYAIFVNAENSLVEGNRVVDCQRAVGILSSASGIVIRNNFISRTSRQGIWLMGANRSQIANNVITDIQGSHSNALSIYSDSSDILVANNVISGASSPITYEASTNLTFFGNVVDGGDRTHAAADWFGTQGRVAFINNTFVRHARSSCIVVLRPGSADYVIVNNVLDGGVPSSSRHDYNLFLRSPGWSLAPNENLETRLPQVFLAAEAADWRPKAESPAVDTGTDPSAYLPTNIFPEFDFTADRNGNTRGTNDAWDRGAYEYSMEPAQPR